MYRHAHAVITMRHESAGSAARRRWVSEVTGGTAGGTAPAAGGGAGAGWAALRAATATAAAVQQQDLDQGAGAPGVPVGLAARCPRAAASQARRP